MLKKIFLPHSTVFRVSDSALDANGNKVTVVEGDLSEVDVVSPNGYRYKNGFWDTVLARPEVKEMILEKECLGCIEHPESDDAYLKTPYEEASHLVQSVTVRNGVPYGKFALFNNVKGGTIKALVDLGVKVGVSTRGMGDFIQDSISDYVDPDNYAVITWDFTRKPNFKDKKMCAVSDSIIQNPLFREMVGVRNYIDSPGYNGRLDKDMKSMVSELKAMINKIEQYL